MTGYRAVCVMNVALGLLCASVSALTQTDGKRGSDGTADR